MKYKRPSKQHLSLQNDPLNNTYIYKEENKQMTRLDYKMQQLAFNGLTEPQKQEVLRQENNFTRIKGVSYDTETGEILDDQLHITTIVTKEQKEGAHLKENLRQHQEDGGGYVFVFFHSMQSLAERFPTLTRQDMARLMFIGTFISYDEKVKGETSVCHLRHDGNGVKMSKKQLREIVGMGKNVFNEFYKRLKDEGVLAEMGGYITVNPTVFYRGENLEEVKGDMQYTRLFRKTVQNLYLKFSGRSISKLAVIYEILPFVNFNYNIVCENPQEVKHAEVVPMKLKDLADKLDYKDYRGLLKIMREVRYVGKPVFKFVTDSDDNRQSYVVVNPSVVYAGNGKHLDGIKVLFN